MNQEKKATSINAEIQDQLKDLRELTIALMTQVKSQNEALLETRSQVKEQAEALRATTAKLASSEVMSSNVDENTEKILQLGTPVERTPVVDPHGPLIQYVMTDTTVHPEKFSGSKKSYGLQSFKLAIERVFTLSEGRFNTDNRKVNYIGSLLEGPAQSWFNSIQSSSTVEAASIMNNVELFWLSMSRHFAVKHSELQAELEFLDFNQDKLRVSEYSIRFRQLASTLKFNDAALRAIFIRNLNPKAKRVLKNQSDIPKSLDEVIELCIRSDTDFLEFHNRVVFTENKPFAGRDSSWAGQTQQVAAVSRRIETHGKMECNYCHEIGHIKKYCPRLPQGGLKKPKENSPKGPATRH